MVLILVQTRLESWPHSQLPLLKLFRCLVIEILSSNLFKLEIALENLEESSHEDNGLFLLTSDLQHTTWDEFDTVGDVVILGSEASFFDVGWGINHKIKRLIGI